MVVTYTQAFLLHMSMSCYISFVRSWCLKSTWCDGGAFLGQKSRIDLASLSNLLRLFVVHLA